MVQVARWSRLKFDLPLEIHFAVVQGMGEDHGRVEDRGHGFRGRKGGFPLIHPPEGTPVSPERPRVR
jgi:hypothetical protein